ncbi:hypothetical protein [Bradyrhizobium sp. BRP23]|uniref:hypothetical protein n=1 Tax=Bradyrhizobium sp. BRP23 TaxID=2793820 RepID=UPI001CD41E67|nr:hypothetical protein [Bradyrhizobium sp. BRP23]MCA1419465.1 hypothetical protein [Bradyrhizobium sp. BRP23]
MTAKQETKREPQQPKVKTPEEVRDEKEALAEGMPDALGPTDYSGTKYSPNAPNGQPPTREQRELADALAGRSAPSAEAKD